MKNSSFITSLTLFILLFFSNNAYAYFTSEEQATINILQKNIDVSRKRVSDAASKVYDAKAKIVSAEKWEAKNWTEVQNAMKNYTKVAQREISSIDYNLAQLLKINPSSYVESLSDSIPDFTSEINELKAANSNLRKKYDLSNSFEDQLKRDINHVKKEILSRTAKEFLNTTGAPKNAKDRTENLLNKALESFNKAVGPVIALVKLPFGLYYYAKEMKAQVKSIKNSKECLQWNNNFRQKTSEAINMSDQGIKMLQGWQDNVAQIKEKFKTVEEKLQGYSKQGMQNAKEREERALAEEVASHKGNVGCGSIWPAKQLELLPASSYTGDALGIIQAIAAAVDSAMNGGDPYQVMEVINENDEKIWRKRKKAEKALADAYNGYHKAYKQYDQVTASLELEREQAVAAVNARCRHKEDNDVCWSAFDQIDNSYYAGYNQAVSAVKPSARTVEKALQETYRLWSIGSMVQDGLNSLRPKLGDYTRATKNSFYRLRDQYSREFYTSRYSMYRYESEISRLINRYNRYKDTYKDTLQNIENGAERESILTTQQATLKGYASQLHSDAKELPKLLQEYHKAESKTENLGQKYQQILSDTLQKDNLLIVSENVVNSMFFDRGDIESVTYSKWKPVYTNREQSTTYIQKQIVTEFSTSKNKEIDKSATIDFNGLAKNIEKLIEKLAQWQDIISLYNARREVAFYLLQAVDYDNDNVLIKLNNSHSYYSATRSLLQKEMHKGNWKSLNTKIQHSFNKIKKPGDWSNKLPREKLLWLQSKLYLNANKILRSYISAHQYGGFAYATNESDFKALEQSWIKLKPLLKQFNQIAAPMQQKLSRLSSDKFKNIIMPATNTYNAMPNSIKRIVVVKQNRLMFSFNMLDIYYNLKRTNTHPLKSEETTKLDEWITTYPIEMKKMKIREAEAQAKQERLIKLRLENAKKTLQELVRITANWIDTLQNHTACSQLNSYKKIFNVEIAQKYAYASSLAGKSKSIETNIQTIENLLNRSCEKMGKEKITNFYNQFKEAYESKDVSAVTSLLSNDWTSASDGTSIEDLEDYLHNSFTVFDDITYNISNLTISERPNGEYIVNYTVNIIGEIYDDDIKHEEKSSVSEILKITGSKVKIVRTIGGRFWSIK